MGIGKSLMGYVARLHGWVNVNLSGHLRHRSGPIPSHPSSSVRIAASISAVTIPERVIQAP